MGPLKGVKIVEVGGIGPGPFCSMMLSDMGADIVRVDRRGHVELFEPKYNLLHRNRKSLCIDLKKPEGVEAVLRLIEQADALTEGFRPGVMENIGLGPDVCLQRNPKLVYGRMTGWGQDGPMAKAAGHDINYIALTGALYALGEKDRNPTPPLNLVGDFGGGGMLLAFGLVCALLETKTSGKGQVVDAAMVDGAATLMAMFYSMTAAGTWTVNREANLLDGGSHFYGVYRTKDDEFICIGSIEPQFYALLLEKTGLSDDPDFKVQMDMRKWPELKKRLTDLFLTKTRDEWCEIMEGTDICFAPVLNMNEALEHPHNKARNTFVEIEGVPQPGPSPRFSRTVPEIRKVAPAPGEDNENVLSEFGFSADEITALKEKEVI